MKKRILVVAFLIFTKTFSCFSQSGDSALNYLRNIDLNSYKNKPVDSFLAIIPTGHINMRIASPGNPKYAEVLSVIYSGNVYAWVYVYNFQYMNPRSETMTWDINLFKKENVNRIEIWKGVECYNGCPEGVPMAPIEEKGIKQ